MMPDNPPDVPPDAPSPAPPADAPAPQDGEPSSDDRTMAMLAHLLAIFTWFIGPLIIWLIKKDTSPFVDDQGKEALNFQITVGLAYIAAGILTCVTFGLGTPLTMAVYVVNLVFTILAAVEASKGVRYRYPFALRLVS